MLYLISRVDLDIVYRKLFVKFIAAEAAGFSNDYPQVVTLFEVKDFGDCYDFVTLPLGVRSEDKKRIHGLSCKSLSGILLSCCCREDLNFHELTPTSPSS